MSDSQGDARNYSREPFKPGHELSVQHGVYSPRKVDPLAAELVERMLQDTTVAYLQTPAFRLALWALGRAEAQVQLLTEYLERRGKGGVGDLDDDRIKTAYLLLHRVETRASTLRKELGLTPLARARLGKDVAQGRQADAAAIMAELHRMDLERNAGGEGA